MRGLPVIFLVLAGCAGPSAGPDGMSRETVEMGWTDLDSLAAAWRSTNSWLVEIPGVGQTQLAFMDHGSDHGPGWRKSARGWSCCDATARYMMGHGGPVDEAGIVRGALELRASAAGLEGVLGYENATFSGVPGAHLVTFRLLDDPPRQLVLIESVKCHRPDDPTWIFSCGSLPTREGEFAPM